MIKKLLLPLVFLLAAAASRFWFTPLAERLPADYANEVFYAQENQFRDSPGGEWQVSKLIARRVDQALSVTSQAIIIQGDLYIYYDSGDLSFQTGGLYGVDRLSRQNLPSYGNEKRSGQYLFPAPLAKMTYILWDPSYIGPQTAAFDHTEMLDGLLVYVFAFSVVELNETDGYSYLPNVTERYLAHTNAEGILWVEPRSGIIVNYQDQGASSFIDPTSEEQVAEFNKWVNVFTPETRAAQLGLARAARLRILALEIGLPAALVLMGFISVGVRLRKSVRLPKSAKLPPQDFGSLKTQHGWQGIL